MHLLQGIGEIVGVYLLGVLELEKIVSTMSCHVDQNVAALIGPQSLRLGRALGQPICRISAVQACIRYW